MKSQQTGRLALRVSKGGAVGNLKANGLEVVDETETVRYVLELGFSVRVSTIDKRTHGLYKANGRAVTELRLAHV